MTSEKIIIDHSESGNEKPKPKSYFKYFSYFIGFAIILIFFLWKINDQDDNTIKYQKIPLYQPPVKLSEEIDLSFLLSIRDEDCKPDESSFAKVDEEFNRKWNPIAQCAENIEPMARDFDPEASPLKFVGFTNKVENSCFFNSTVQVLYQSRAFRRLIKGKRALEPLAALFHLMDMSENTKVISPLLAQIIGDDLADGNQYGPIEVLQKIYGDLDYPAEMQLIENSHGRDEILMPVIVTVDDSHYNLKHILAHYFASSLTDEGIRIERTIIRSPEILCIIINYAPSTERLLEPEPELLFHGKKYRLIGFTTRTGSEHGSGHFIGFVPGKDGNYIGFDDMRVFHITKEQIQESIGGKSRLIVYELVNEKQINK